MFCDIELFGYVANIFTSPSHAEELGAPDGRFDHRE